MREPLQHTRGMGCRGCQLGAGIPWHGPGQRWSFGRSKVSCVLKDEQGEEAEPGQGMGVKRGLCLLGSSVTSRMGRSRQE